MATITLLLFCTLIVLVSCGGGGSSGDGSGSSSSSSSSSSGGTSSGLSWASVDDYLYQLQGLSLGAVGTSAFDLAIIDYSRDGSDAGRYTAPELATLKDSPGGQKLLLAYMSIGEAEDYRWYWQAAWDSDLDGTPEGNAPAWLGPSNPNWPGNYKVKYWDPAWQALIMGTPSSYLDKLIEAGFDGVYLDIIDAYDYWGPGGASGLGRQTAEQEMVDFVKAIATYARTTKGQAGFGVFPQNGEELSSHEDYLLAVTGIGREDVWYNGNTPQPAGDIAQVSADLDTFLQAGKLVMVVDYVTTQALIDDFYQRALARGYVPYATVRALDTLTINPGHAPD